MAGTHLQGAGANSAGNTSIGVAYGTNLSSGSKLIAYVIASAGLSAFPSTTAVKDTAGNSFTKVAEGQYNNVANNVWDDLSVWVLDTPVGDVGTKPTITATISGAATSSGLGIVIQEVSGLQTGTSCLDGTAAFVGNFTNNASVPFPTYSSTAPNEYLVQIYTDWGNNYAVPTPSGYSAPDTNGANGNAQAAVGWKNSTGGSETGSWGPIGNGNDVSLCGAVAFLLAGSGASGTATVGMAMSVTATLPAPPVILPAIPWQFILAQYGLIYQHPPIPVTQTQTDTATVTASMSVTAGGTVTQLGSAAVTEVMSVSAAGTVTELGAATVGMAMSVTASGSAASGATATVAETLSVTTSGLVTEFGAAVVTEVLSVTALNTSRNPSLRFFPTQLGPGTATVESGSFTVGTAFQVTEATTLEGFWWWVCPAGGQSTSAQTFALWQETGNNTGTWLGSSATVTSGALSAGWNYIPLATPYALAANTPYRAVTGIVNNIPYTQGYWKTFSGTPGVGINGFTNGILEVFSGQTVDGGTFPDPNGSGQSLFGNGGSDPTTDYPVGGGGGDGDNAWIDVQVTMPAGVSTRMWTDVPDTYPTGGNGNDAAVIAVEFALDAQGPLSKIWHYSPPGSNLLPTRCAIWDVTSQTAVSGTDNASPTWLVPGGGAAAAGDGWIYCDYSTAGVALNAGQAYKAATYVGTTNYPTPGTDLWFLGAGLPTYPYSFASGGNYQNGLVNGNLVYPNDATASPGQGSYYNGGSPTPTGSSPWGYPSQHDGEQYWVDVEVGLPAIQLATATVGAVLSVTAAGTVTQLATATVTEVLSVTASGSAAGAATATVTEVLSVTAAGIVTKLGTATVTAVLSVTATGTATAFGTATVTEVLSVTASGTALNGASANPQAVLAVTASATTTQFATATVTEALSVIAAGVVTQLSSATVTEVLAVVANAGSGNFGTANVTAQTAVTAAGFAGAIGAGTVTAEAAVHTLAIVIAFATVQAQMSVIAKVFNAPTIVVQTQPRTMAVETQARVQTVETQPL